MRLFIAEKPSLARTIAEALPGPRRKCQAWIECGDNDVVAWCAGHILEQAPPDAYGDEYKSWRLEHLPIVPAEWKLIPKTRELLLALKSLLKKADRVVHAGDPDREGQLLVDEVIKYLGYKGPVDRVRIQDATAGGARNALAALRPNSDFRGLSEAALARSRADWLYGMNLTRLYTLQGRAGGHDDVLSVGRVQTPVLGLVVRRDREIEDFKPKPFFTVGATCSSRSGEVVATWRPSESDQPFLDEDGRLVDRSRASLLEQLAGTAGTVASASIDKKSEAPPLPFNLADLQIEADRVLGLKAKETLDACQALYEAHRLTTYPRSDCAHLPEAHFENRAAVAKALGSCSPALADLVAKADLGRHSKAWNDSKVTAHHAIIPTSRPAAEVDLGDKERAIYELIASRYLAQFYGPHVFNVARLELRLGDEVFIASSRQTLDPGWRATLPPSKSGRDSAEDGPDIDNPTLPPLQMGDPVEATEIRAVEKKTTPPKRFTEGSLVQAMIGIARFVDDPKIRQILGEADGIGTPATRAEIIETLFKRGFLKRSGRQLISTTTGRMLISVLPAAATTPDMTAIWEAAMRKIADGKLPLDDFLRRVLAQLQHLVDGGKRSGSLKIPGARPCPRPGCSGFVREVHGKKGAFFGCTRYPVCKQTVSGPAPKAA